MRKLKSVLFVDDDEITSFVNRAVVEHLEVAENILCLDDELKALEYLRSACVPKETGENACPELIFLDLNMLHVNAFDFLEQLQADPVIDLEKVYIVLLTSLLEEKDTLRARQYQVHGLLQKPLTTRKMEEVVRKFHNWRVTG